MSANNSSGQEYLSNFFSQTNRMDVAVAAFLVYNLILTLDQEVNVVWTRPLSWMHVLYIMNRYGELACAAVNLALFHPLHDKTCRAMIICEQIATMLPFVTWIAFSSHRAYALSDRRLLAGIVVFAFSATSLIPNLYVSVMSEVQNRPPPANCGYRVPTGKMFNALVLLSKGGFMISEIIVIALTLIKTAPLTRLTENKWRRIGRGSIMHVLIKNSIMCFSVPLLLNAVLIVADYTADSANSTAYVATNSIGMLRNPLTSVLVSRFLLELEALSVANGTRSSSFGEIITSDITMHPSDVLSIPEMYDD